MEQQKINVLMVDDEPDFTAPIAFWLRTQGYQVTTAISGEEGLRMIREAAPHVVFLDINMPGLNGLDTLREIRRTHPQLPVIMVTAAYQDEQNFAAAHKLGMSGFFPKHGSLPELLKIITFACQQQHTKSGGEQAGNGGAS